ncbi:MAG: LysR family transcriptional regulator [Clostridium lundense]|nr:LysR family transcriptional regulator [Clostridium lundense]
MDIRQLEIFATVARVGSFTKAADELYLTRQALSKSVKRLEESCGKRLFAIEGNRIELTEDGQRFLEAAEPVLRRFNELDEFFTAPAHKRELRLAVAQGLFETIPEDFGGKFLRPNNELAVSIEESSSDGVTAMLRNGEVDVAMLGSHPKYLQEFEYVDLAHPGYHVSVPLQNPLASRDYLELEDLDGQPFVTLGKRNHLHRFFVEECTAHGIEPNVLAEASEPVMFKKYCDEGTALAFACAPKHTKPKGLSVDLPLGMHDSQLFGTFVCRRKGVALPQVAEEFWGYLVECSKGKGFGVWSHGCR